MQLDIQAIISHKFYSFHHSMFQSLTKVVSLLQFSFSSLPRLIDIALSTLSSTLTMSLFAIRYYNLGVLNFLLLGNVLLFSLLNIAVLGFIFNLFAQQSFNRAHLYRLRKEDLREFALEWSRAHYFQLFAVVLAVLIPETGLWWLPTAFLLSYAFVMLAAVWSYRRILKVAKASGRTLRVPSPFDFDKEVDADIFAKEQCEIIGSHRIFKKRIQGELRNTIFPLDKEITLHYKEPVQVQDLELSVAAFSEHYRGGAVEAYFDEQLVLRKPISMLHPGWNDFQDLADESGGRKVSEVKLRLTGNSQAYFSPRRVWSVQEQEQRNVIVIVIDGLRKDMVGLYNGGKGKTPSIDRFFEGYTRYERAYTQGEWTLPTFASMATSLYSSQHGVVNPDYAKLKQLPGGIETLAEVLQRNGYHTFAYVSSPRISHILGHQRGYDRFVFPDNGRNHRAITDKALEVFHTHPRENKFLLLHYMDLRSPFRLTSPFSWDGTALMTESDLDIQNRAEAGVETDQAHYFTRMYANKVGEIDFFLDVLFSYIERSSLRDNTTVILLSDHGVNLPTDHIKTWTKKHLSEERLCVPLLVRCPWREETHSKVYPGLVESSIDLYSTVAELAGIDVKCSPYSRSFLPDEKGLFRGKEFVVTEMVFKGNYECRIWDTENEYIRSMKWMDGQLTEELRKTSSGQKLDAADPSFKTIIERYRKVTRELSLLQPHDNPGDRAVEENRLGNESED